MVLIDYQDYNKSKNTIGIQLICVNIKDIPVIGFERAKNALEFNKGS